MAPTFLKQCKLRKSLQEGTVQAWARMTAWIPEAFARKGQYVELRDPDGNWDKGWQVDEVGTRQSEEYVREHERDYTRTRKASDI